MNGPSPIAAVPRQPAAGALGVLLLVLSVAGIVHGVRAAAAYTMYFRAEYGAAKDSPPAVLALAERAHGLYPFNYSFCLLAGETAYAGAEEADPKAAARNEALARRWCEAGLALNPYASHLRLLKTRLLSGKDLPGAIRYWEDYVNWDFWMPFHHAVLVELYSLAGDFDKATRSLRWVRGSEYYDDATNRLHAAWKKQMDFTGVPVAPR